MQAQAALQTIGTATYNSTDYNLIYDNDLEITWLDYSNNLGNWDEQVDWAAGLNTPGELTYNFNPGVSMNWGDAWRLPTTVDGPWEWGNDGTTTAGYNITSSEMGHLYYTELGNKGYYATDGTNPQLGWGLTNTGDFQNLQADFYWSGTEYAAYTSDDAWFFDTYYGYQYRFNKSNDFSALAVRPGQLAVVPEPISSTLFIVGSAMLGFRRKFKS